MRARNQLIQDGETISHFSGDHALLMTRLPVGCGTRLDAELHVQRRLDGRLVGRFGAVLRHHDGRRESTKSLGSRDVSLPGPFVWPSEEGRQLLNQHFDSIVAEQAQSLPSPREVARITTGLDGLGQPAILACPQ